MRRTRSADYLRFLAEAEARGSRLTRRWFRGRLWRKRCCLDLSHGASGGQVDVFVSKESLRDPLLRCPESLHSQTLRWGQCRCQCLKMQWRWTSTLEWSQCWCEEVQREPVRCGRNVLVKPTWEYVQTLLVSAATVTQLEY